MQVPIRRLGLSAVVALGIIAGGAAVFDAAIDPEDPRQGPASGLAASAVVRIEDFEFDPGVTEVPAGSLVAIENADATTHTVTEDPDGGSDFDVEVPARGAGELRLDDVGTYTYLCLIHPDMRATIEVRS